MLGQFLTMALLGFVAYRISKVEKLLSVQTDCSPEIYFSSVEDLSTKTITKGTIKFMQLKEGQKVEVGVSLKTRGGHKGNIESGTAQWSSSDESIATVTPNPTDPLKATIRGVDGSDNSSATIEFRADADTGEGVRELIAAGTVTVTTGDAFVASMEFGTPEDDAAEPTGGE